MTNRFRVCAALVAVATLTLGLRAASAQPIARDGSALVKSTLIASTPRTSSTQPVKLALKLEIAPKWHIYWLNPGDSGMPTAPQLKLPEGWKASDWKFPTPIKFEQPGGFVGYGYKDQAVLIVELTPPESFTTGEARIEVETSFLVCDDICLPGSNRAVVTLAAEAPDDKPSNEQFVAWESLIPKEDSKGWSDRVKVSGGGVNSKTPTGLTYTINMPTGAKGYSAAEVFPLTPEGLEVSEITATPTPDGAVIKMKAKLYSGQTNVVPTLAAVVVWSTPEGRRVAHWFNLPLPSDKP